MPVQPECSQLLREAGLADAMKELSDLPDDTDLSKFLPVLPTPAPLVVASFSFSCPEPARSLPTARAVALLITAARYSTRTPRTCNPDDQECAPWTSRDRPWQDICRSRYIAPDLKGQIAPLLRLVTPPSPFPHLQPPTPPTGQTLSP